MELWSTVEESYLLDFAEECPLLPLHAEDALTSAAAMNEPLELRQAPRAAVSVTYSRQRSAHVQEGSFMPGAPWPYLCCFQL